MGVQPVPRCRCRRVASGPMCRWYAHAGARGFAIAELTARLRVGTDRPRVDRVGVSGCVEMASFGCCDARAASWAVPLSIGNIPYDELLLRARCRRQFFCTCFGVVCGHPWAQRADHVSLLRCGLRRGLGAAMRVQPVL